MKKSKGLNRALAVVIVLVAALILYTVLYLFLYRPTVETTPSFETEAAGGTDENGEPIVDNAYNRKDGEYNFLFLGYDRVAFLTDFVALINYNVKTQELSIIQMPRDTYVENETGYTKINTIYKVLYGKASQAGSKTPEIDTLNKFADVLETNMCINIDYVSIIDLDGLENIVDRIGGVELYVPMDMDYDDSKQNLHIHLKEGQQTLNGNQAEQFVRFRSDYVQADIGRGNAQKIFMSAFLQKLKSSISITNVDLISDLAGYTRDNVKTSLSLDQMIYFAKSILGVDMSKVVMLTASGVWDGADGAYVLNRADLLEAVNKHFNVFNTDITDSIFDKKKAFVDESSQAMLTIYNKVNEDGTSGNVEYTADGVNEDSIYIPAYQ